MLFDTNQFSLLYNRVNFTHVLKLCLFVWIFKSFSVQFSVSLSLFWSCYLFLFSLRDLLPLYLEDRQSYLCTQLVNPVTKYCWCYCYHFSWILFSWSRIQYRAPANKLRAKLVSYFYKELEYFWEKISSKAIKSINGYMAQWKFKFCSCEFNAINLII